MYVRQGGRAVVRGHFLGACSLQLPCGLGTQLKPSGAWQQEPLPTELAHQPHT